MKFKINYGCRAGAFPLALIDVIDRAKIIDVKIFLTVCSVGGVFPSDDMSDVAKYIGCTQEQLSSSIAFWRGTGVIDFDEEQSVKTENAPLESELKVENKKNIENINKNEKNDKISKIDKIDKDDKSPKYTSDEIAEFLSKNQDLAMLIDACQNIIGKIFNTREINVLMVLVEHLGLDSEYIMLLTTYCVEHGKKTLFYIEKLAFSMCELDIVKAKDLSSELKRRDKMASMEEKVKKIFGISDRPLSTKEKNEVSTWITTMNFSLEVIEKSFDITVDATGKNSLHYANSILERWFQEGIKTIEEIDKSAELHKIEELKKKNKQKDKAPQNEGSFNTDNFFEAAVKRSLENS